MFIIRLHDSSKVAASACERVSMGRPGDVPATSVMGYDQTDDFGMVCFVPPTSSVCRVYNIIEKSYTRYINIKIHLAKLPKFNKVSTVDTSLVACFLTHGVQYRYHTQYH